MGYLRLAGIVMTGLMIGTGCSSDEEADPPPSTVPGVELIGDQVSAGGEESGSVAATDQRGPGDVVVVDRAELLAPGFLVAYRSSGGAPGSVMGTSALLEAGEQTAVEIPIDEPLTEPTEVFVMVHGDADANGVFEFPGPDVPSEHEGGALAVQVMVETS